MQASKLEIGKVYGVTRNGEPQRFRVDAVVTTRSRNTGGPHDYSSEVRGVFLNDGDREGLASGSVTLKPDEIKGPYEEFAELVARTRAANDKRAQAVNELKDKIADLRRTLYAKTSIAIPNDIRPGTSEPFAAKWGNEIEISGAGIDALLKLLKELP